MGYQSRNGTTECPTMASSSPWTVNRPLMVRASILRWGVGPMITFWMGSGSPWGSIRRYGMICFPPSRNLTVVSFRCRALDAQMLSSWFYGCKTVPKTVPNRTVGGG